MATNWEDVQDNYMVNENAINWSGALVYALALFLPEGEWPPLPPDPVVPEIDAGTDAGDATDAAIADAGGPPTRAAAAAAVHSLPTRRSARSSVSPARWWGCC